jgi:hypothetical protein
VRGVSAASCSSPRFPGTRATPARKPRNSLRTPPRHWRALPGARARGASRASRPGRAAVRPPGPAGPSAMLRALDAARRALSASRRPRPARCRTPPPAHFCLRATLHRCAHRPELRSRKAFCLAGKPTRLAREAKGPAAGLSSPRARLQGGPSQGRKPCARGTLPGSQKKALRPSLRGFLRPRRLGRRCGVPAAHAASQAIWHSPATVAGMSVPPRSRCDHRRTVTQVGAWSLAFSSSRTHRSTPAPFRPLARTGLSSKWSMRSPRSRSACCRK